MILGKEQERLKEEAEAAAAAAQRLEHVLSAVARAHAEPLRHADWLGRGGGQKAALLGSLLPPMHALSQCALHTAPPCPCLGAFPGHHHHHPSSPAPPAAWRRYTGCTAS